jgi:hypothetical protein
VTKLKLLFIDGLYKKGQLGSPFQGMIFLCEKALMFNQHLEDSPDSKSLLHKTKTFVGLFF